MITASKECEAHTLPCTNMLLDPCRWHSLLCCRYRHTSYHKQTKNQWARDDPAFVLICCGLVATAATAYCLA